MDDIQVRWLIQRDIPTVLRIEESSFDDPWDESELIYHLRRKDTVGLVAETSVWDVVGYSVYRCTPKAIVILNLAVDLYHRRTGVGSSLIKYLKSKLSYRRRRGVNATVVETNLAAQLFLRSQGFVAVGVSRGHYDDGRDAYRMRYVLPIKQPYGTTIAYGSM